MAIVLGNSEDTYNSAHLWLKIHGQKAEKMALERMLDFIRKNDIPSAGIWLSIANIIEELTMPRARFTLH